MLKMTRLLRALLAEVKIGLNVEKEVTDLSSDWSFWPYLILSCIHSCVANIFISSGHVQLYLHLLTFIPC